MSLTITFDEQVDPVTTDVPTTSDASNFNEILANIERMRVAAIAYSSSFFTPLVGDLEIKDDWLADVHAISPDYNNANRWEEVIDILYVAIGLLTDDRHARCGVAMCNSGLLWNNRFRS